MAAQPKDEIFRVGLSLLWQADTYAHAAGAELWDFALEIGELYETGLTISDLRWLMVKGFARLAQETSAYGDPHRSCQPSDGLNFTATTCFVLTPQGTEFAAKVQKESAVAD